MTCITVSDSILGVALTSWSFTKLAGPNCKGLFYRPVRYNSYQPEEVEFPLGRYHRSLLWSFVTTQAFLKVRDIYFLRLAGSYYFRYWIIFLWALSYPEESPSIKTYSCIPFYCKASLDVGVGFVLRGGCLEISLRFQLSSL